MIHQLCEKHPMLHVLHYSSSLFADKSGLLKHDMGRYNKETMGPLESDHIHPGSSGIRAYAAIIKSHIIRPKNNFSGDYRAALTRNMHTFPNIKPG